MPENTNIAWWQRVFWLIGGFDPSILAQPQCRAIRSKYSTIGALVLLTALLASCSGGYAIYTIFHDLRVTWIMGTLWGLMILTVDRFLVSSTRKLAVMKDFKKEPDALPPYRPRNPWLALAVRLPLAIVIGLVVSAPIEARLMQPWIAEYERSRTETRTQAIEKEQALVRLENELNTLEAGYQTKNLEVEERRRAASEEADGTGGSGLRGTKSIWNAKNEYYLNSQKELDNLSRQIEEDKKQLSDERSRLLETVKSDSNQRAAERSIISDLAIIREIAASPGPKANAVWVVSFFLTLLFVLIECIPVLAKAISSFDPYDATLQEIEHGGIMDSLVETRRRYAEASLH